jgi:glyoxylase-like metal-dependent hydrolase (beta-lactamase superfamily II)
MVPPRGKGSQNASTAFAAIGSGHNHVTEKRLMGGTDCRIRFFNHACYSVSNTRWTLISDPYFFGTAFNEGWDLIWRDVAYEGLDQVTHIWYSHEHPDHFSPRFLFSIPSEKQPLLKSEWVGV